MFMTEVNIFRQQITETISIIFPAYFSLWLYNGNEPEVVFHRGIYRA